LLKKWLCHTKGAFKMNKSIEEIANEAHQETTTPEFIKFLRSNPLHVKILEIMAPMGLERGEKGPMEFSIMMGMKCYELGGEDKKKEMEKSYQELKDWAESKGLDVTTYGNEKGKDDS
jgi:hypothetical protein